jgi:glucose/arabinose dehydrogenase
MKIARLWVVAILLFGMAAILIALDAALARAASPIQHARAAISLFSLSPFADGFDEPVGLEFTGAINDTRMFVLERRGLIWIVQQNGDIQATPFLSLTSKVTGSQNSYPEAGLLGLAFDPDYASNGKFYVYYTDIHGDIQLSRFSVSGNPEIANPAETSLLKIPHPVNRNHNGGQLAGEDLAPQCERRGHLHRSRQQSFHANRGR